jgi:hypothetical protein
MAAGFFSCFSCRARNSCSSSPGSEPGGQRRVNHTSYEYTSILDPQAVLDRDSNWILRGLKIQTDKKVTTKIENQLIFLSAGCSLLKAEGRTHLSNLLNIWLSKPWIIHKNNIVEIYVREQLYSQNSAGSSLLKFSRLSLLLEKYIFIFYFHSTKFLTDSLF